MTGTCDECHAPFEKTTHTKRFCSQSCAMAWRKRNRTKAAAVDELREWREKREARGFARDDEAAAGATART